MASYAVDTDAFISGIGRMKAEYYFPPLVSSKLYTLRAALPSVPAFLKLWH
jgi:hypothetical protein